MASDLLNQAIQNDLLETNINKSDIEVVIQVFASTQGMAKVYNSNGIAADSIFWDFVRGFNIFNPLSKIIDSGPGKDCTDHAILGKSPNDVQNPGFCHTQFGSF